MADFDMAVAPDPREIEFSWEVVGTTDGRFLVKMWRASDGVIDDERWREIPPELQPLIQMIESA